MNTAFTIVRDETQSANLVGNKPCPIVRNLHLGAHLLERTTDGAHFLLIGATTDEGQARRWAEEWIADQAEKDEAEKDEAEKDEAEKDEAEKDEAEKDEAEKDEAEKDGVIINED